MGVPDYVCVRVSSGRKDWHAHFVVMYKVVRQRMTLKNVDAGCQGWDKWWGQIADREMCGLVFNRRREACSDLVCAGVGRWNRRAGGREGGGVNSMEGRV